MTSLSVITGFSCISYPPWDSRVFLPGARHEHIHARQTISIHITNCLQLQVFGPLLKLLGSQPNAVEKFMLDIARRRNQEEILRKRRKDQDHRRAAILNYGERW